MTTQSRIHIPSQKLPGLFLDTEDFLEILCPSITWYYFAKKITRRSSLNALRKVLEGVPVAFGAGSSMGYAAMD